jgi:4-nitrophenyl phosphatase
LFQPLVASTGRNPIVLGKPHATMLEVILNVHHLDPKRTCMIGDRLDTDIQFGINGGCSTLLVLTGTIFMV